LITVKKEVNVGVRFVFFSFSAYDGVMVG